MPGPQPRLQPRPQPRPQSRAGRVATAVLALCVPALLAGTTLTPAPAGAQETPQAVCDPGVVPGAAQAAEGAQIDLDPARVPFGRMHVREAQRLHRGGGQVVAVLDSGVAPGIGIDVRNEAIAGLGGPVQTGHGTLVAGLIAGPDGVAPEARILSMRVYDTPVPNVQQGQRGVDSHGIAEGLDRLARLHDEVPFKVVNVSLSVNTDDPGLKAAVYQLQLKGVVVVAAAGNSRGSEEGTNNSDVEVYPADYPGVVAVSAVGPDPEVDLRTYVAPNADTDVAAPTVGAISVNANGQRCLVEAEIATSYAAAQVSGVLALMMAHRPDETGAQAVARLLHTAEGSVDAPNPWVGAGVVQAADALQHELQPSLDGQVERSLPRISENAEAPPPPPRTDVYAESRRLLLWTALGAVGLLGAAVLLRPLRRRRVV